MLPKPVVPVDDALTSRRIDRVVITTRKPKWNDVEEGGNMRFTIHPAPRVTPDHGGPVAFCDSGGSWGW
jgi:hypothetical protein